MKKYIITIITLFLIIIISVGGFFAFGNAKTNQSNDVETLKSKATSEIEYISSNIISMMNDINNISYSNYKLVSEEIDEGQSESDSNSESSSNSNSSSEGEQSNSTNKENTIKSNSMIATNILSGDTTEANWDNLNNKVQELYSSWTTIMMDLSSLNVNKDKLLKFNDELDEITQNILAKDKRKSLIALGDLYNLITLYIQDFSNDAEKINIFKVRSNILYSYAYTQSEDWAKVGEYISKAKQDYSNILNSQVNNINKIDVINKAYILLNELEKDATNKNVKVFLVNYTNLMQELQSL